LVCPEPLFSCPYPLDVVSIPWYNERMRRKGRVNLKSITFRVPEAMWTALVAEATRNERSIGAELRYMMQERFRAKEPEPGP